MQMNCLKALMPILANLINNFITENHSNYMSRGSILIFEIRHKLRFDINVIRVNSFVAEGDYS